MSTSTATIRRRRATAGTFAFTAGLILGFFLILASAQGVEASPLLLPYFVSMLLIGVGGFFIQEAL